MSTLRVAMLIRAYAPTVGGAERQLGAMAPRLQAEGLQVHVVTRREHGLPAYTEVDGVPVHRVPVPGPVPVASLAYSAAATLLLRRLRPDVVHAHEFFSPGTTAVAAKRLLGLPAVATAHRSGPLGDVELLQADRTGRRRLAALVRSVDRFVCISQDIVQELAGAGVPAERLLHLPNGVDVERFRPVAAGEREDLRAGLGLPARAPVALFTGRLADEKRVAHLLRVWPAVREHHPAAVLAVLGTGPLEQQLRAAGVPGVRFAGLVEDVAPWHRAADLFVLPSVAEGLSVAMLEALASGVPALMSDVGGAGEVLGDGRAGRLLPPDDVGALERAVVELLGRPERLAEMGAHGRHLVQTRFTLGVGVRRHAELYAGLAAARRRG